MRSPSGRSGKASEQAAIAAGVSPRYVELAKTVRRDAPDLAEKVRDGDISLTRAEKQIKRSAQLKAIAEYQPPSGRYQVIVADPPWPYEKRVGDETSRGHTDYPVMTVESICKMQVPADEDCILWLWTTNAHLLDGSAGRVLEAWGFQGKTMLTWAKDRMGAGDWLRGQTEHCILAVKGRPMVTLTNQTTLLPAKRTEHSRKPPEFFALVETLCPGRAKLELFARESRPGWVTSGAELPADPRRRKMRPIVEVRPGESEEEAERRHAGNSR